MKQTFKEFLAESAGKKTFNVTIKYDDSSGKGIASATHKVTAVRDAEHAKHVAEIHHLRKYKNGKIARAVEVK